MILAVAAILGSRSGQSAEIRFALVIGNDTYKAATLATPSNDAGLIADTLQSAGFTVSGARNLDQDTLRRSFREFLDRVAHAGPDAVALVYLAGVGVQFEGENYFIPVDADVKNDVDIPIQAIRISDFTRPLAALPGRVKIVILDAARQNPFATGGQPLAGGLALVDPDPSTAIAFNAAPGTVGPNEPGPYGAFAMALAEMIQTGGLGLDDLFARVRLRVDEITQGAEVPWYASQIKGPFELTVRAAGAPPLPAAIPLADVRGKPMRSYTAVEDAYAVALERDSLEGYEEFLAVFPDSPYSRRIDLMLAARREAMIWRRCVFENSPPAYWSYLRRYPDGPHAFDARRRLRFLSAAMEPPMGFALMEFGVPPPPPRELGYFRSRTLMFNGPGFGAPPPAPPRFLPPRPREFAALPPPPRPGAAFVLPTTAAGTFSVHVRPPATVAAPPAQAGRPATPGARAVDSDFAADGSPRQDQSVRTRRLTSHTRDTGDRTRTSAAGSGETARPACWCATRAAHCGGEARAAGNAASTSATRASHRKTCAFARATSANHARSGKARAGAASPSTIRTGSCETGTAAASPSTIRTGGCETGTVVASSGSTRSRSCETGTGTASPSTIRTGSCETGGAAASSGATRSRGGEACAAGEDHLPGRQIGCCRERSRDLQVGEYR